jgi:hypothetical protein
MFEDGEKVLKLSSIDSITKKVGKGIKYESKTLEKCFHLEQCFFETRLVTYSSYFMFQLSAESNGDHFLVHA